MLSVYHFQKLVLLEKILRGYVLFILCVSSVHACVICSKSSPRFSWTREIQSVQETGRKVKLPGNSARESYCISPSPYQRYLPSQNSLQPRLKRQNIPFLVSSHVILVTCLSNYIWQFKFKRQKRTEKYNIK